MVCWPLYGPGLVGDQALMLLRSPPAGPPPPAPPSGGPEGLCWGSAVSSQCGLTLAAGWVFHWGLIRHRDACWNQAINNLFGTVLFCATSLLPLRNLAEKCCDVCFTKLAEIWCHKSAQIVQISQSDRVDFENIKMSWWFQNCKLSQRLVEKLFPASINGLVIFQC